MAEQKFRLISRLAELTRETKITADMRLVATFSSEIRLSRILSTKSNKTCYSIYDYKCFL